MLDHIFLHLIGGLGGKLAVQAGFKGLGRPGIRTVQTVQGTQAGVILHLVLEFVGKYHFVTLTDEAGEAVKALGQLTDLLPQAHTAQQVGHPLLNAQLGILIRIHANTSSHLQNQPPGMPVADQIESGNYFSRMV